MDNRVVAVGDGSFVINNLESLITSPDVPANTFYVIDSTKGYILDRIRYYFGIINGI